MNINEFQRQTEDHQWVPFPTDIGAISGLGSAKISSLQVYNPPPSSFDYVVTANITLIVNAENAGEARAAFYSAFEDMVYDHATYRNDPNNAAVILTVERL